MPVFQHPVEDAILDGVSPDKEDVRQEFKQYPREFVSVALFRQFNLADTPNAIIAGVLYHFFAGDTTTPDDGVFCVHDAAGRRFKTIPVAMAGNVIFIATAVAGTANAIEITAAGMPSLSATPLLALIFPSTPITGPATIRFNGGAIVPLLSNVGAALSADDVLARPTLVIATSTDTRIIAPW